MLKHNMRAEQSLDICQRATRAPLSREVNKMTRRAFWERSDNPLGAAEHNISTAEVWCMGRVSLKNTNIICGQNKALIHAKDRPSLRYRESEQNDP